MGLLLDLHSAICSDDFGDSHINMLKEMYKSDESEILKAKKKLKQHDLIDFINPSNDLNDYSYRNDNLKCTNKEFDL